MVELPIKYLPMNKKILFITFSLLIGIGVFLRFYNLRNTQFTWDQENSIAFPAKEIIIDHHFPLIGARTGVGDLRLSPLYSYLGAIFFYLFKMDPIAGAILAAILSTLTIILGFALLRKIINFRVAFYFTLIWSVSPLIIFLDRIPWNVNLLPLASLLLTVGLYKVLEDNKTFGWMMIGFGIFLGVNSHFSIYLLIISVFILFVMNKKIMNKAICIPFFFLFLGILPLILFDIRHDFILSQNIVKLLTTSTTRWDKIIIKLYKTGLITLETLGRLIIYDGTRWFQTTVGAMLLIALFLLRKNRQVILFFKIFITYLVVYFIGFSVYSGVSPEYYYLGILPIGSIGYSIILSKLHSKFPKINWFLLLFCFVVLLRSFTLINELDFHSLGVKQQLISKIKEQSGNKPISIVYDMELGWSYGYDYLFDYYKIKKTDRENTTNIFWLSFPRSRFPGKPDYIFGDFALGLPVTSQKILNTKNVELYGNLFKLRIPKEWQILQCQGVDFDKYLLTSNLTASCSSYDREVAGIAIVNIPNCNIWEMQERQVLKTPSQLSLYTIPVPQNSMVGAERLIVTSFERNRCIGFTDLGNKEISPLSLIITDILESARK